MRSTFTLKWAYRAAKRRSPIQYRMLFVGKKNRMTILERVVDYDGWYAYDGITNMAYDINSSRVNRCFIRVTRK